MSKIGNSSNYLNYFEIFQKINEYVLIHTLTHKLTHTHTHTLTVSHSHTHTHSHSLTLTHTHAHSHTHTHS